MSSLSSLGGGSAPQLNPSASESVASAEQGSNSSDVPKLIALASRGGSGKWNSAREELLVHELSIAGMNYNLREQFPKKFLGKYSSAFEGFEPQKVSDKLKTIFNALDREDIKGERNKKFLPLRVPVRIYPRPRSLKTSLQKDLWTVVTSTSDIVVDEGGA